MLAILAQESPRVENGQGSGHLCGVNCLHGPSSQAPLLPSCLPNPRLLQLGGLALMSSLTVHDSPGSTEDMGSLGPLRRVNEEECSPLLVLKKGGVPALLTVVTHPIL